ncbi:ferritin-like protein [Chloroflexi bacterium TSY]|nr:ferritin-like protein [Chloroflexi bacterium TSY]
MSQPNDFSSLQEDLRAAMSVELTTMPPYLYTYWSIRPLEDGDSQAGVQAARTIMSVALEEMLHMGLVANILNALGGRATITDPLYVPSYPGQLLRHSTGKYGVEVGLLPLSSTAIDTFLKIELPESDVPDPPSSGWATIGQFYESVESKITDYAGPFNHGRQLPEFDNPGAGRLIPVESQCDAIRALKLIVDQGEGTSSETHDDGNHELAHYWKFMEIKTAIENGSLHLTQDVYPVISNPADIVYSPDQQAANKQFNLVYSELLDSLQTTLTSEQPGVFPKYPLFDSHLEQQKTATTYMDELGQLAGVLRHNYGYVPWTEFLPGPTFEYIPATAR